jgi:MYXO-CTERM domain-containing protein
LVFGAGEAYALTLADLAGGQSFTAGNGVTYGNFAVKGKKDLAGYVVQVDSAGFSVTGPAGGRARGNGGKLVLSYSASTNAGFLQKLLSVDGGTAKRQVFADGQKLGKLVANKANGSPAPFDVSGLDSLEFRDTIRLGGSASMATSITAVPEPSTLGLALAGMGALAALRRRAS